MGAILAFVRGPIAGYVFGGALLAVSIAFAVTAGVYHFELASITRDRDALKDRIDNPSTGYVVRTAQCETNVSTLRTGLNRLSGEVEALAAATREGDARTAAALALVASRAGAAKAAADKLLALPARSAPGTLNACRDAAQVLKRGIYQ